MKYPYPLTDEQINKIIIAYKDNALPITNNYTTFRAKIKQTTLTIYKTKTVLLQGGFEENVVSELNKLLGFADISNNEVKDLKQNIIKNQIGTDEVGTGDFFGGIVVCGCYVPFEKIKDIIELGVKDSKEIKDNKIIQIAPKLMDMLTYSYLLLDNLHYNYLTLKCNENMNSIKAKMHNSVITSMKKKVKNYDEIIIDAFTTKDHYFEYIKSEKINEDVLLVEKAENKFLAVACASIIARYIFINHLKELGDSVNMVLPKGAGVNVDDKIRFILSENKQKILKDIAKMNFNNLKKVLNQK